MAELRCPMCSHLNPDHVEECQQCGARLVPLSVSPDEELGSSPQDFAAEVPDWLARIRDQVEDHVEPDPGNAAEEEEENWLGRLRETTSTDEPAAVEPPVAEPPAPEPEFPTRVEPSVQPPAQPESDTPEWLSRIRRKERSEAEAPVPAEDREWMDRLRGSTPLEPEAEQPAPEPEPDAVKDEIPLPDEGAIEEGLRWLEDLALDQDQPKQPLPSEPGQVKGPAPPVAKPPPPPTSPPPVREAEPEAVREELAPPDTSEPPDDLPHVPALILDDEGAALGGDAFVTSSADLPDWLGEMTKREEGTEESGPPSEEREIDLAPATLPAWLEAMRPVDTFRSVVEIEPEEEQAVESVGPLAGLRGVLMAEPIVAMPRSASIGSMQLNVTERHYAQAELLHRMVLAEERETTAAPMRTVGQRIVRWTISLVLLVAVSLPILLGGPTFDLPNLEPRELGTLYELVNSLPVEQPSLLVFDYEPGFSGELDAVAGSFIEQLMMRGVPLVTLSTRPTGAPLAVRLINRYSERYGYLNGESFVHLGYLSGGPTAVQLFAIAPGDAILKGFALPIPLLQEGASVWDARVLEGVQRLEDFSMVAVITAGTESARTWAEQAQPRMEGRPMVMILSAGSEPLIQPYYEARDPQVRGLLSGLPAATAYERRNGTIGLAQIRWNAFGMGMFASELVLLVGLVFGVTLWWARRRR